MYDWMSTKHLHRCVAEFEGRNSEGPLDTIHQVTDIVRRMLGQRLGHIDAILLGATRLKTQWRRI